MKKATIDYINKKGECDTCGGEVEDYTSLHIEKLKRKKEIAEKALKNIINPIDYLQEEAKSKKMILNGEKAIQLINHSEFFSNIAKKALEEINSVS